MRRLTLAGSALVGALVLLGALWTLGGTAAVTRAEDSGTIVGWVYWGLPPYGRPSAAEGQAPAGLSGAICARAVRAAGERGRVECDQARERRCAVPRPRLVRSDARSAAGAAAAGGAKQRRVAPARTAAPSAPGRSADRPCGT